MDCAVISGHSQGHSAVDVEPQRCKKRRESVEKESKSKCKTVILGFGHTARLLQSSNVHRVVYPWTVAGSNSRFKPGISLKISQSQDDHKSNRARWQRGASEFPRQLDIVKLRTTFALPPLSAMPPGEPASIQLPLELHPIVAGRSWETKMSSLC